MANLSLLLPDVLPNVVSCPNFVAQKAILNAVTEFFIRSKSYRVRPADITVVADTGSYTIADLPATTAIAWLLEATLDSVPLSLPTSGDIPLSWSTETGTPEAAVVVSDTAIGLRKVPDASGTLSLRLALRPTTAATTYPDDVHALYREHIAAGALARLYAMNNVPWSAVSLVDNSRSFFESGIRDAEFRADRGSSNAPARTKLNLVGRR